MKGHWDGWGWGGEAERMAFLTLEDDVDGIETYLARPVGPTGTLEGQEAPAVRRETGCTQRQGSSLREQCSPWTGPREVEGPLSFKVFKTQRQGHALDMPETELIKPLEAGDPLLFLGSYFNLKNQE